MIGTWTLVLPEELYDRLHRHLIPGDGQEHGAVITAGVAHGARGSRLLAREVIPAQEGIDYLPGTRGHRMLTTDFIHQQVQHCRDQRLAYLAVHNHSGTTTVAFSPTDLESHQRGYPALRDLTQGQVVGGLVFAEQAVAGDLWLPDGSRTDLAAARIVGRRLRILYPAPLPPPPGADPAYDRQARLFGDRGQALLATLKVGVIGAGGAGSLLLQWLAHLGIDHLVAADPDRLETPNLPRVVGATRWDAHPWLTDPARPAWARRLGHRLATSKVRIAQRVAGAANPSGTFEPILGNVIEDSVARRLVDCDYLFLAADTMQARAVFNALVHQYLIPGMQVGVKVPVDQITGDVGAVFTVARPVTPDHGCLWCNGLIDPTQLREEGLSPAQRDAQRYVDDQAVIAPSVITLNALGAAMAADDFLFTVTGLHHPTVTNEYLRFLPRAAQLSYDMPRADPTCLDCGSGPRSRRARGDTRSLPTRPAI
jgi:molybdopterin/thiamine biosynthesis adenylyltransferase